MRLCVQKRLLMYMCKNGCLCTCAKTAAYVRVLLDAYIHPHKQPLLACFGAHNGCLCGGARIYTHRYTHATYIYLYISIYIYI